MQQPKYILSTSVDVAVYEQVVAAAERQEIAIARWVRQAILLKLRFEEYERMQRKQQEDNDET